MTRPPLGVGVFLLPTHYDFIFFTVVVVVDSHRQIIFPWLLTVVSCLCVTSKASNADVVRDLPFVILKVSFFLRH